MTNTNPSARFTDPATSRRAASKTRGHADEQRHAVLLGIRRHPGSTACEIAEATGIDRYAVSRRAPELRARNLVQNGLPRLCRVKGTLQMTWLPVEGAT